MCLLFNLPGSLPSTGPYCTLSREARVGRSPSSRPGIFDPKEGRAERENSSEKRLAVRVRLFTLSVPALSWCGVRHLFDSFIMEPILTQMLRLQIAALQGGAQTLSVVLGSSIRSGRLVEQSGAPGKMSKSEPA